MRRTGSASHLIPAALLLAASPPGMVAGVTQAAAQPAPVAPTYADAVELAIDAPVIVRGTVARMKRLRGEDAVGVEPGRQRHLMEVAVTGVLVSPSALPGQIRYLWDAPLDGRGRAPKLKGEQLLLFLRPVPGREGQFVLTRPEAQFPWSAPVENMVRKVLTELRSGGRSDMRITGLGKAFHVPGSVPGEGESQIFLITASGKPVSLVVLTRPGQPKRVQAAFGDVIDEAAADIQRDTLFWYYLACGLPPSLPPESVDGLDPGARAALAADYGFVLAHLGACRRTLPPR